MIVTVLGPAIIDLILTDVDDEASLRECALTSRLFLLPAQRLLFREISIPTEQRFERRYMNGVSDMVERLSDILSSSPHLLAFVREVNIGSMYGETGWNLLEVLLRILGRAKLERFSTHAPFDTAPPNICVALTALFAQPSLQDDEIKGAELKFGAVGPHFELKSQHILSSTNVAYVLYLATLYSNGSRSRTQVPHRSQLKSRISS
ncbi:hypothetical protein C8R44DRAFT_883094 [Mycena epipterygia]|nr:hypothetical protein C8R44DRAFT_883094 [Mycena epipterygia]